MNKLGTVHLALQFCRFSSFLLIILKGFPCFSSDVRQIPVLFVSIVLFYVLFVCKCVLHYCHRVATQFAVKYIISYIISYISYRIVSYHIISYHISYHIISCHIIYHIIYLIISYII